MKKTLALLLALLLALSIAPVMSAGAEQMDVLRIGIASMSAQFDPGYSIGIQSIKIFYNIYDTLLTTDKDGKIEGMLADKWNWVDDKTLDVTIRDNVTFHNGEACTSEDVYFTFDRILSGFGDGTIAVLYETLESVEIIDELTVRFHLKQADAAFENRLGSVWGANIVPKDYLTEIGNDAFQKAPVGTGPYSMVYSPEKITLNRYEGFWGDKPNVDKIEFIVYPEKSARMIALINGEVDIINDVTADLVDTINSYKGLKVTGSTIKNIHIYVFNTKADNIMSNQKFRQALTIAMDRQALVDAFWGDYAYNPQGHQFKAYGDLYIEDYAGIQYDVEYAKQLVKESGYNGEEITIQMRQGYYMNGDQAGEAVCDMWKEIGVNARVEYMDKLTWTEYPHVRTWSSASRFDNPLGCLWLLFGPGSNPAAKGNWDVTEEFQKAGETLISSKDLQEQRAAARTLLEVFDTVCPGTYLYMAEDLYGVRDGLDWDMTYCENQIMPFRADDFKLAE